MPEPTPTYHLMVRIKSPGRASRVEDLLRDSYTVGRGDPKTGLHADFEIPDDGFLSRIHCRLSRTEDSYAVENLSPNGTRLNGKALTEKRTLKHRDRVECGEGTSIEFLALTAEERARELATESAGAEAAGRKKKAKKPITQRPVFWGVILFYGILMMVLLSAAGDDDEVVPDPGGGPYFAWALRAPLQWDEEAEIRRQKTENMWDPAWKERIPPEERTRIAQEMWGDARLRAQVPDARRAETGRAMWKNALVSHGEPGTSEGGNDYRLLRQGLQVLGHLGFDNLKAAADSDDHVGKQVLRALTALEERTSRLHLEGDRLLRSGHRTAAGERYTELLQAVPDRYAPLHRFARDRLERIRPRK